MTKIPDDLKTGAYAKALRYLGYRGSEPDEATAELIETGFRDLAEVIDAAAVNSVADKADVSYLLIGSDVNRHLEGCTRVMITAATLGAGADRLIHIAEIRNMAYAVVLDALASALIEEYADDLCEKQIKRLSADGTMTSTTWRFSPGYGDYPIELQPVLLKHLNAEKQIGLTATKDYILLPRKSITGVIGLSTNKLPNGIRGCAACNMRETCQYRKDGITCGE